MRVLVSGGAGFIGSSLIRRILQDDPAATVRILDNLHRGRETFDGISRVECLVGDIRDRSTVREAMNNIDLVYHLAAQSSVIGASADMDYSFTTNVAGTFEILSAAREYGVKRMIFASSREVYGSADHLPVPESALVKPKNGYGASKAAGELYCRVFMGLGLEVVVLRLANAYGPGDSGRVIPLFIEHACKGLPLVIYGQRKVVDFVWIGDVVSALVKAQSMSVAGQIINIGSGEGTSLATLAQRIRSLTNSSSAIQYAPPRTLETDEYVADIGLARNILDYHPSTGLAHLCEVTSDYMSRFPR
jgi:UDP-glucose 4-epimerase